MQLPWQAVQRPSQVPAAPEVSAPASEGAQVAEKKAATLSASASTAALELTVGIWRGSNKARGASVQREGARGTEWRLGERAGSHAVPWHATSGQSGVLVLTTPSSTR